MKEFDLEKAKAGAKVCTRKGESVRILCWDRIGYDYPIIALVLHSDGNEDLHSYAENGTYSVSGEKTNVDLMLEGEKKEGWVNVSKDTKGENYLRGFFEDKCAAESQAKEMKDGEHIVATIKIEWEE